MKNTIQYNGKNYELKYNMKRIEMIEAATNMPTLAELKHTGGMLSLTSLKIYFSYGLKEAGSDSFLKAKESMEICEQLIQSAGYAAVCGFVLESLERDCPFFFRAG